MPTMNTNDTRDSIRAKIFGQMFVSIKRLDSNISWEQSVYAINWFDAWQLQLYNFYNLLAGRSVSKVGGVPLFKGRLLSKLYGSDEDQRQILLLVRYPAPDNFRRMVANPFFKVVSLLRMIAVRKFTFCLSHVLIEENIPKQLNAEDVYGVHHFRGDTEMATLIGDSLHQHGIDVIFSSIKTHELFTVTGNESPIAVPALMDGIVLFKCKDEISVKNIITSNAYQNILQQSESSFVGTFKRIM